jgi:hypothetical protein
LFRLGPIASENIGPFALARADRVRAGVALAAELDNPFARLGERQDADRAQAHLMPRAAETVTENPSAGIGSVACLPEIETGRAGDLVQASLGALDLRRGADRRHDLSRPSRQLMFR